MSLCPLIYMQARFYAPMYGRFLSPDPARDQHFEETQSWNIYSYVQNDPTMRIDPTGMFGPPSDRQDFIRQCKQMGMSDAQIQGAVQSFNKGQTGALKVGLAISALPVLWEIGGPLLARTMAALGSAEAPQAVQKGQEILQEAQQAAPEVKQAAQGSASFVQQLGSMSKDALGQVLPKLGQVKQVQQLVGDGKPGSVQAAFKAVGEGKLPQGLTVQAVQTYAEIAKRAVTSNPGNTLQVQRLEICNKALELLQKR